MLVLQRALNRHRRSSLVRVPANPGTPLPELLHSVAGISRRPPDGFSGINGSHYPPTALDRLASVTRRASGSGMPSWSNRRSGT
jgi:hypothetical protein